MKILLGIVVAILTLKWWPDTPEIGVVITMLLILVVFRRFVSEICFVVGAINFIIGAIIGCLLATCAVDLFQHKINTALTITKDTNIAGEVGSLFTEENGQTNVIFDVDTVNGRKLTVFETFKARFYWRSKTPIRQGQRWSVTARLREPYGRVNEAGFDAETFFLSRHIHVKGSVLSAQMLKDTPSVRQIMFERVLSNIESLASAKYLIALAFGERSLLTRDDWQQLRDSGLAHLVAISGLHIGLAYFFGYTVTRFILPIVTRQDIVLFLPICIGLLCAFLYAWMAGFSLTAQRALIALTVISFIRQTGYEINPFHTFLIVLCSVLIFDPFSVFSASFWLSFGAVYLLCVMSLFLTSYSQEERGIIAKIRRYLWMLFLMQCVLLIGMMPLMWTWFGGLSLSAIIFNLFAVPLISLITVPLILLALMFTPIISASSVWMIADISMQPLLWVLNNVSSGWIDTPTLSILFPVVLVVISFVFLMVGFRRFNVAALVVLALFVTWKEDKAHSLEWRVDVLDIGHGLAVIIEKGRDVILYDTGAAWSSGTIAEVVVAPIIIKRGSELDGLILSHGDNDHAGGVDWVVKHLNPNWIRSSELNSKSLPCLRGQSWRWKGLYFKVLYPIALVERAKNAESCVIRISDGTHSVLLTGDIPAAQEAYLVREDDELLSDVLIVPHHGSKTSSSAIFLDKVKPQIAIASTGRYTPWKIPHPSVVKRYQQRGIDWFETGKDGQISVLFSDKGWRVISQRFDAEPFWYRKMFGAPKRKE